MEKEEIIIEVPYEEFIEMSRKAALFDALREYNMRSNVVTDDATKALLGLNYKPAVTFEKEPHRIDDVKEEVTACCV